MRKVISYLVLALATTSALATIAPKHASNLASTAQATVQTTANAQLAIANPLRQPGQYLDAETGLHYNDRRYYDADTGRCTTRCTSRDPIGFEGGINLYTYAGAAPSRFTDPTGEIIPCVAANFARCMIVCGITSAGFNAATGQCIDLGDIAKDCALDCLLSMLPIPDPCGRFGKLFGAAIGIGTGLANSFEANTLVHTRVLTDSGYQTKLKPIKDIQIGDEVLAWDELQAHDNAALAQAGQAAPSLLAAYQLRSEQNSLNNAAEANLPVKSASSPSKCCTSSYENNSTVKDLSKPTSAQRYEKVTDIANSFKAQTLLHLTLDNGQTIQATAGHPFKTQEGWRDAVLLKKGGKLLLGGGADEDAANATNATAQADRYATITDIREEVKTTAVFNLEVANLHTFFVGVDGVVVHNGKGNSASSTSPQHGYDIFEIATGAIEKTGISGGCINKNGKSRRAQSQVNKWNKEAGYEKYGSDVAWQGLPGTTRGDALGVENARAQQHYGNNVPMGRHDRPGRRR